MTYQSMGEEEMRKRYQFDQGLNVELRDQLPARVSGNVQYMSWSIWIMLAAPCPTANQTRTEKKADREREREERERERGRARAMNRKLHVKTFCAKRSEGWGRPKRTM